MALKLKEIQSPAGLAVLNRWAEQNDSKVLNHDKQITQLHSFIKALLDSNPSLIKPGG